MESLRILLNFIISILKSKKTKNKNNILIMKVSLYFDEKAKNYNQN